MWNCGCVPLCLKYKSSLENNFWSSLPSHLFKKSLTLDFLALVYPAAVVQSLETEKERLEAKSRQIIVIMVKIPRKEKSET